MAITAIAAYELFKTGVGGSLELPLFASKRARMTNYDNVPAEVLAIWATTTGSTRADGETLYGVYKAAIDAETWSKSVITNDQAVIVTMPLWAALSTKIQTAFNAVATATA